MGKNSLCVSGMGKFWAKKNTGVSGVYLLGRFALNWFRPINASFKLNFFVSF